MDFEAFQKFATTNLSDYLQVSFETVIHPGSYFEPLEVPRKGRRSGRMGTQLDPQLMAFAATSMFLGLTATSLMAKRPEGVELLAIEIVGVIFWWFYAALVHLFCKIARGRGLFLETVSVIVQVFATLYVFSSVLTLLYAMSLKLPPVAHFISGLGDIGEIMVENPAAGFFAIDTILLSIYLPLSLKRVHGFGLGRQLAVAIPTVAIVLVHGVAMMYLTGYLWSATPPTTP